MEWHYPPAQSDVKTLYAFLIVRKKKMSKWFMLFINMWAGFK